MLRKCLAEFLGTAILVTFGCGAAAWGASAMPETQGASYVGIALAFGLCIVALAYSIGNVSGCHVNPAVSFAMLINGKMTPAEFCGYVVAQCCGAIVGSLIMIAIFINTNGSLALHGFGTNGYGEYSAAGIGAGNAIIVEIVLTFVFVFAICGVTSKECYSNVAGIVIGLTLTLVHIVGLPLTGTSVNPARSLGAAVGAAMSGETAALGQVWVFLIAPMFGAALAALFWKIIGAEEQPKAPAKAKAAAVSEPLPKVREIKKNSDNKPQTTTNASASARKKSNKKRK